MLKRPTLALNARWKMCCHLQCVRFPLSHFATNFHLFDFLAGGDDGAEGDDNDDAGSDQDFAG